MPPVPMVEMIRYLPIWLVLGSVVSPA